MKNCIKKNPHEQGKKINEMGNEIKKHKISDALARIRKPISKI